VHSLVGARERQILGRCLPAFLDEAVKKNHPLFPVDVEHHATDTVGRQIGPDLMETVSHRPTCWHPDRPAEFDLLNVFSDHEAIWFRQIEEPIANRPNAVGGYIKARGDLLAAIHHGEGLCQKWHVDSSVGQRTGKARMREPAR